MEHLDFLSPPISIRNRGHGTMKSPCGSILSVIIVILTIIIFFVFGADMFDRRRPNVFYSKALENRPFMQTSELMFAVGMMNRTGNLMSDWHKKIKFIGLYEELAIRDRTGEVIVFELVPCEQTSVFNQTQGPSQGHDGERQGTNPNEQKQLENLFKGLACIPDEIASKPIYGTRSAGNFSAITVQVLPCADDQNCLPLDQIMKELNQPHYLNYFFINNLVQSLNYSIPVLEYLESHMEMLDPQFSYRFDFLFNRLEFASDHGRVFEDMERLVTFQKFDSIVSIMNGNRIQNQTASNQPAPNQPASNQPASNQPAPNQPIQPLASLSFSFQELKEVYERSYLKLQYVLAYTGAFINLFYFLFKRINRFFAKFTFYTSVGDACNISHNPSGLNSNDVSELHNINNHNFHNNPQGANLSNPVQIRVAPVPSSGQAPKSRKSTCFSALSFILCRICSKNRRQQYKDLKSEINTRLEVKNLIKLTKLLDILDPTDERKIGRLNNLLRQDSSLELNRSVEQKENNCDVAPDFINVKHNTNNALNNFNS